MTNEYRDDPGVQWMLAYQAGDEHAFEQLVGAYSGQVFALLTRFLGARANREDLVQDVFLRVIRARARYEPTARFSTWLYRIVFHLSINETQRAGGREQRAGAAHADGEERAGDGMDDFGDERASQPYEELERGDVVRAVRAAIGRLPETQRMALILAKYDELPYVEIAEVLGSTEKAVKSLVHRARESLRETLAPFLQGELS